MLSATFLLFVIRFLLDTNNVNGEIFPQYCKEYEESRICGPSCPIACDTLNTNECCDVVCASGCFCQDGYILASKSGPRKCVLVDDCPKPGILEIGNVTVTVLESSKIVVIAVLRLNGSAGEISVRWRTVEGAAKERTDFVPSTGILVFPDGVTFRTISIVIIDDSVREPDEDFSVVLSDPTNKAEISPRRFEGVRIIIKDDDMMPGYIEADLTRITVVENIGTVNVTLVRLGGTDGEIQIRYRTVDGTAVARLDYVPITGYIVFNEGEKRKVVSVNILDDDVREPTENFQLILFEPSAAPDVVNFRAQRIRLTTTIIIMDDDMKPGYVELFNPIVTVPESIGSITLNVIRKGGQDGEIRTRYRTVDGTAMAPSDYVFRSGELVFKEGVTMLPITIGIINDKVMEPTENFRLELFEPSAAPDVINFRSMSSRTSTSITIIDDDMEPGYLELEQVNITVKEDFGTLHVTVVRIGGTDGMLRLKYRTIDITATAQSDYVPVLGDLVFADGEKRKIIPITILNDKIKELVESFRLQIYDLTAGSGTVNFRSLGTRLTALITIIDDDETPGYIEMELSTISVPENVGTVQIPVIRVGGSDGQLRVRFNTMDGTAVNGQDYRQTSGEIIFNNGETRKTIFVIIIDDSVREITKQFQVQLSNLNTQPAPVNFRQLGSLLTTSVSIIDNDFKAGLLEFERSNVTVIEDIGEVEVTVIRVDGTDGMLRVNYRTLDGTAAAPLDYTAVDSELIFEDGVDRLTLRIRIIDDQIKEPDESFSIQMFEPGAIRNRRLGRVSSLVITIKDNDNYPGVFEFQNARVSVAESIGSISLTIVRKEGSDGLVRLQVRTRGATATEGVDYLPPPLTIVFPDGTVERTLQIQIIDDDIKEDDEEFLVGLFNPTNGVILGRNKLVTVTIIDDDEPCIIRFVRRTGNFRKGSGFAEIPVIRENRLDRRASVYWRTEDRSAIAGQHYRGTTGALLIFNPRERQKTIRIGLVDNTEYEKSELFDVVLFDPSRGAVLGIPSRYTVEILDNDQREADKPPVPPISYGIRISFTLQNIRVREDAGEVRISISRSGAMSPFTVRIRTVDGSAMGRSDYRRTRGQVSFKEGDVEVVIAIRIINDEEYETDETFTVELYEPSLGTIPIGLNVVTITIIDDDAGVEGRGAGVTSRPQPQSTGYGSGGFGLLTKCPDHLILKECANSCPPTCSSMFGKAPCSLNGGCVRGCFCPEGFVKENESSDVCVRPSQCRGKPPSRTNQQSSRPVGLLF